MGVVANSHKTAIHRRTASCPCLWLAEQDRLVGPVLDWGCGHGRDVEFIRNAYGYDPHHQPDLPERGELFNTILCTYVLDTISGYFDRCVILEKALEYLIEGGWLYVSIHREDTLMGGTPIPQQEDASQQLRLGGFTLLRSTGDMEIWGWQKCPALVPSPFTRLEKILLAGQQLLLQENDRLRKLVT